MKSGLLAEVVGASRCSALSPRRRRKEPVRSEAEGWVHGSGHKSSLQFEALGAERVNALLAVMYVDHNVLQIDEKNMDEHRFLHSFCAEKRVLRSTLRIRSR